MPKSEFDIKGFFRALDIVRIQRDMNWKQIAEMSGVSASTLSRIAQGKRPDVDSLAALLNWSGLSADTFVSGRGAKLEAPPEPLSQITSVLYADRNLPKAGRDAMVDMITAAYARLRKSR